MGEHFGAFVAVAALIAVTPGVDTALVVRNALRSGSGAARRTALGSTAGLLLWGTASALGIAAVLATSATGFAVVKVAGAVYLLWVGLRSIASAGGGAPELDARALDGAPFRQGMLSNLLNPKAALFFSALLPQFLTARASVLQPAVMTLTAAALSLLWLSLYAWLVPKAGDVLRRPRVRAWVDRVTGTALVSLGVRLALTQR